MVRVGHDAADDSDPLRPACFQIGLWSVADGRRESSALAWREVVAVSLDALEAALARAGVGDSWQRVCAVLDDPMDEGTLELVLDRARAVVLSWPERERAASLLGGRADAPGRWIERTLAGAKDPRVALVGWASIERSIEHDASTYSGGTGATKMLPCAQPGFRDRMRPAVMAFAQRLDRTWSAPEVMIHQDNAWISAAGCGGGFDTKRWGDADRGATWYDTLTEHSADESSDGAWTPYGIAPEIKLSLGHAERWSGTYTLAVTGPMPAALEVARAWEAILRMDGASVPKSVAEVHALLARLTA
jgi:hypothetical protein